MAISFKCGKCQAVLKVPDEMGGKRGKCPKCLETVQIPLPKPETLEIKPAPKPPGTKNEDPKKDEPKKELSKPASPSAVWPPPTISKREAAEKENRPPETEAPKEEKLTPEQMRAKVLTGFRKEVVPVPVSALDNAKLSMLVPLMVMLPLLYILFILLIVGAASWHLAFNTGLMSTNPALYFGPPIAAAIAVMFLLKPFLIGRAHAPELRTASRAKEPILFDFIEQVCKQVEAPVPHRIVFDCSMNATAERRSKELRFMVGVPMLACMTLDQFAGIVSWQFGRFSRAASGPSFNLCCNIHDWLVRCVFDNDRFDAWLSRVTSKPSGYIFYPLWVGVWLTRKVLYPFMWVGHAFSAGLVRRREVNADRYESRVVGTQQFERILSLRDLLEYIWQSTNKDLEFQHKERKLFDNLPRIVIRNLNDVPEEVRSAFASTVPPPVINPFSSRLTDAERLEVAREEKAEGVFFSDLPAHALLTDFDALAKDITWDYYLAKFGPPLVRKDLKPVVRAKI